MQSAYVVSLNPTQIEVYNFMW